MLSLDSVARYLPRRPLENPDAFEVLWDNNFSNAGVYLPTLGSRFILAEHSSYEPDPHPGLVWKEDDSPFHTTGDQLLLDLNNQRYNTRDISYHEGEIQGLVYALDAMRYGGRLEESAYQAFIEETIADTLERLGSDGWDAVSPTWMKRFAKLGYASAKSVLLTQ